jgi:hypothetical protein
MKNKNDFKKTLVIFFVLSMFLFPPLASFATVKPYVSNPRYWQYNGAPIFLRGGSDTHNPFNVTSLDPIAHLDLLKSVGGNYIRNTMSSRENTSVHPHAKIGSLYNLNQWNQAYWDRFQRFLQAASDRGIIVQIEMWDRWDHQGRAWENSSWNPKNNSNYTAAQSNLPEGPIDPEPPQNFLKTVPGDQNNTVVLPYQQAFVRKILSISLNFPNVLYCVNNETKMSVAWSDYWAKYMKDYATSRGKKIYLSEMKDPWDIRASGHMDVINKKSLYDYSEFSQNNHQKGQTHYDRPIEVWNTHLASSPWPMNNAKTYGGTAGTLGGDEIEGIKKLWRNVFSGMASSRYHRPPWGPGLLANARANLKSLNMLLGEYNLFTSTYKNTLLGDRVADEAYLIYNTGKQYAVYFPNGGSVKLNLSSVSGQFSRKWLNVGSSQWQGETKINGGSTITLSTPSGGNWVALIKPSVLPTLSGDLNGDGKVDIFDYTIFISEFGKTGSNLASDLNKDGKVDIFDYTIFSQNFGKTQ